MSRTLAIGCGLICATVLTGCGGSQPAQTGYLYRYGNGESFIQWHRHGQKFHGTVSTTQSCCVEGPARLIGGTDTINGTISGSNVFFHASHWHGTLHSYGLLIRTEPPGGVGVRFRRASIADYNAAVAQTKARVERQKKRQAAEQATTSTAP
jgi:hypothetical protein